MVDQIIDDVKALLDKDYGEKRILEQILRAAENNEVISNYERNYVRKLAEKYLDQKPQIQEKEKTPDVLLPEQQPSVSKIETITTYQEPITKNRSKNKIILGIGGLILALVIIGGVALSGVSDLPSSNDNTVTTSTNSILTLQTDLSSYKKADLISISGKSDPSLGEEVSLSIENQSGTLVWFENLKLKSDGRFATLAIAGGDGWESGTFTLKAIHGDESQSLTFIFTG